MEIKKLIRHSKTKEKIQKLSRENIKHLINENNHLRELSVGTLEALKLMPGYDEAIEKLKQMIREKVFRLNYGL